jgi:putative endonuclease
MYFVYLLECGDGSYYTGITTDVERRFNEHKNGKGGHYTGSRKIIRIVYQEEHPSRSSALKKEALIKSWTRQEKIDLIKSYDPKLWTTKKP